MADEILEPVLNDKDERLLLTRIRCRVRCRVDVGFDSVGVGYADFTDIHTPVYNVDFVKVSFFNSKIGIYTETLQSLHLSKKSLHQTLHQAYTKAFIFLIRQSNWAIVCVFVLVAVVMGFSTVTVIGMMTTRRSHAVTEMSIALLTYITGKFDRGVDVVEVRSRD